MDDGSGLKYFLTDHLGSTVAILDDEGTLIEQQRYLPFGGERTDVSSPIVSTDFNYTGQRDLDGTGLMDYKFRMYSPTLGRFISPDDIIPHIDRPQTWNRYSYVYNRPINLNDPTGHCGDCILDIGFILMDLAFIAKEGWTPVNTAALVADVVAAFVPVATGAGLAIRGISRGAAVAEGAVRIPAVLRGVQVIEKIGQMFMATTNNGGENQYTRRGKQAHKNYRNALGEGYDFEQVLPSGKRVDAINEEERIVRELKPDNPRAIARGLTQVKKYAEELSRITGEIWKYFVDTYKR